MRPFKNLLFVIISSFMMITIMPISTYAETIYGYSGSGENVVNYYSVDAALEACKTTKVVMKENWSVDHEIVVDGTFQMEMNGHSISRSNKGRVFSVSENGQLYLTGNLVSDVSFTVKDYSSDYAIKNNEYAKIKSGGLVTGGHGDEGGAIYMNKGSLVSLKNVAIAGNFADAGGGIYVGGDDCTIDLHKAYIAYNKGRWAGGAIGSKSDGTRIYLEDDTSIYRNYTEQGGGGIYIAGSYFNIVSSTRNGYINENRANDGGAIDIAGKTFGINSGTIEGITFKANTCKQFGGAIAMFQNNTTVKDCTISDNTSNLKGGGIYTYGKNIIQDTTIKNNRVQVEENNVSLEGGGIYCHGYYDITFKGKVIVTNNIRRINTKDDVFLATNAFWTKAYILADGLDINNSLIGIRTEESGDRRVVKNLETFGYGYNFFLDDSSYHLGFESNDKELWQRKDGTTYTVSVGGTKSGVYKADTKNVSVAVDNSLDNGTVFDHWENLGSLQLSDNTSNIISFTMPSHNVDLQLVYANASTDFVLNVDYPSAGEDFPTTAVLTYKQNGEEHSKNVKIGWYAVDYNGKHLGVGKKAENNKSYVVYATINKSSSDKLYFLSNLSKDDITVKYNNGNSVKLETLKVDDKGTISFVSNEDKANRIKVTDVAEMSVTVKEGTTLNKLKSMVWTRFIQGTTATLENGDTYKFAKFNIVNSGDGFGQTDVFTPMTNGTYVVKPESGYYTFTVAPYDYQINLDLGKYKSFDFKVYVESNGVETHDETNTEETSQIVTASLFDEDDASLLNDENNEAVESSDEEEFDDSNFVYIKSVDDAKEVLGGTLYVDIDVPKANEILPSKINKVSYIDDYSQTEEDVTEECSLDVTTWFPGVIMKGDNVKARYDCVYHAKIKLLDIDEEYNIKNIFDYLDIVVNEGKDGVYYSWFTVESDVDDTNKELMLHIVFSKTEENPDSNNNDAYFNYSLDSIDSITYSNVSYEDASKANNNVSLYDLPSKVNLKVTDIDTGEESNIDVDIKWNSKFTNAFDLNNTNAQQLLITGQLILPSYIDNIYGLDTSVSLTINVDGKANDGDSGNKAVCMTCLLKLT